MRILLLLCFPAALFAQYEKILSDPDVTWAAEITCDFLIEPELATEEVLDQDLNHSTWLKLLNSGASFDGALLSTRLLEQAINEDVPVYFPLDKSNPLTSDERGKRIAGIDTIIMFNPDTYEQTIQIVHREVDPTSVQYVRARQLLYFRKKTANYALYTYAIAPLISMNETSNVLQPMFWFKMPPFKGKEVKSPKLKKKYITWARRLRTRQNTPRLDEVKILKREGVTAVQQVLKRASTDRSYKVTNGIDPQPLSLSEISRKLFAVDTIVTFDPETFEEKVVVVKNETTAENVHAIALKQDWFWDDKRKRLIVTLHAFAPMVEVYDNRGAVRYELPLFWRAQ